jgi:hypothetical protein
VTDLDWRREHLLTHAKAMGGWLTANYVHDGYAVAAETLVVDGLMGVVVKDGRDCYQLTDTGRDAADQILQGADL